MENPARLFLPSNEEAIVTIAYMEEFIPYKTSAHTMGARPGRPTGEPCTGGRIVFLSPRDPPPLPQWDICPRCHAVSFVGWVVWPSFPRTK